MAAQTAQATFNGTSRVSIKAQSPDELAASLGMSVSLQAIRARQAAEKAARLTRYKEYRVIQQG